MILKRAFPYFILLLYYNIKKKTVTYRELNVNSKKSRAIHKWEGTAWIIYLRCFFLFSLISNPIYAPATERRMEIEWSKQTVPAE